MIEDRVAPKPFWFITTSPRPHQHGNCLVGIAHFETDPFGGLASAKNNYVTTFAYEENCSRFCPSLVWKRDRSPGPIEVASLVKESLR